MRRIGWGLITCVATLAFASSALGEEAMCPKDSDETVTAEEVGQEVESVLNNASETGLNGLKLSEATLSIETGTTQEVSGSITLIGFTISHKSSKGATQTTTLQFKQPPAKKLAAKPPEIKDLKTTLAKMIATGARLAATVKSLPLAEAKVKIEFVAQRETGGALTFKVLAAEGSGGINFKKVSKNSLEVTFAK